MSVCSSFLFHEELLANSFTLHVTIVARVS